MNDTECLILSIIWIILSLLWFWIKNTAMGVIWLCAGIFGLVNRKSSEGRYGDLKLMEE